jgi:CheY-like chemotaxis protein
MANKPKILVVEDEIENQKYLQLVLRKKFDIDFCDTKNSMFNLLTEKEYKTIIMDISLKNGYTGVDLIKELKRKSDYKNIPIVCLSGHAYGENRRKAEELGANIYLTKPVPNQVLLNTLDKLIDVGTGEETEA